MKSKKARKTNSFVRFFGESTAWQFGFEINWPLGGPPSGHYGHLNTLKPISPALNQSFGITKTNTFNCDSCDADLTNKRALSLHIRVAHRGQTLPKEVPKASFMELESNPEMSKKPKPFQCKSCSASYTSPYRLKTMWRSIIKKIILVKTKKPFKCFICNVSYANKKDLNEHKGKIMK